MTSINTNIAATTALRTLQQTNSQLDQTQQRISTGLKIGSAKDNAAYWSISTALKSDNKSLGTVKDALNLGAAAIDVNYQGLNNVKEVLEQLQSKLTSASGVAADRQSIQEDINNLKRQLEATASSSGFAGENWLSVDTTGGRYNVEKSIVSSFSRDANGAVTLDSIDIDTSSFILFDKNAASGGLLDTKLTLKNANGDNLGFGGTSVGTLPDADAISGFTQTTAGRAAGNASQGSATLGTLNLTQLHPGDSLTFDLSVNGAPARTVSLATTGLTAANFASNLNLAIDDAIGANVATASIVDGKIVITSDVAGANSSIAITNSGVVGTDGETTSVLGMTGTTSPQFGASAPAAISIGTFTANAAATDAGDGITFRFTYNGTLYEGSSIGAAYSRTNAAAFTASIQNAINAAQAVDENGARTGAAFNTNPANSLTVSLAGANADEITLTTGNGSGQSVGFSGVTVINTTNTVNETAGGIADAVVAVERGTQSSAVASIGTLDTSGVKPGDKIAIRVNVSNTVADLTISTDGFTGVTANDRDLFVNRLNQAIAASGLAGDVTAAVDSANEAITLTSTSQTPTTYITVSGIAATDGDGAPTTTGVGILNTANASAVVVGGQPAPAAQQTVVTAGTAFGAPITLDVDDSMSFTVKLGNAPAQTIRIDKAAVDAVPGLATPGTISDAGELAAVVQSKLGSLASQITVGQDAGRLTFTVNAASNVALVVTDGVPQSGGDQISLQDIDINSTAFNALTDVQRGEAIRAYIAVVVDRLDKVTTGAANLGSVAQRIDLQESFVSTLMDTIEKGISGLVDADMNEESTRLQALQVKQQLGVQALSIANQSAQNVLSLFR